MKYNSIFVLLLVSFIVTINKVHSQEALLPDQNPNYKISENKYTKLYDSLVKEHATTLQHTYKAIDYLEDKKEARAQRRLARSMRPRNYYDSYSYIPPVNLQFGNGYFNGYHNGSYNDYYNGWGNRWRNDFPVRLGLNWWIR